MPSRDSLAVAVMVLGFAGVIAAVRMSLGEVDQSLRAIQSQIGTQTAQQSWLVEHYAKPVRPLHPWQRHRCEWCGAEKEEGDK